MAENRQNSFEISKLKFLTKGPLGVLAFPHWLGGGEEAPGLHHKVVLAGAPLPALYRVFFSLALL